ncbi:MAG: hypothetical protein ACREU5_09290 [Burkholderiales bacterium]
MNAPESRRRLTPPRKSRAGSRRRSKAFLAELRRQCQLANKSDRHDDWQRYLHLPE